jgi:hypothetical protein
MYHCRTYCNRLSLPCGLEQHERRWLLASVLRSSFWYLLSSLLHMPTTGIEPVRSQVAISPPSCHAPASLAVLVVAETRHTGGRRGIWTAAVEFRLDGRPVRMPMTGVAPQCGSRARAQGLLAVVGGVIASKREQGRRLRATGACSVEDSGTAAGH